MRVALPVGSAVRAVFFCSKEAFYSGSGIVDVSSAVTGGGEISGAVGDAVCVIPEGPP